MRKNDFSWIITSPGIGQVFLPVILVKDLQKSITFVKELDVQAMQSCNNVNDMIVTKIVYPVNHDAISIICESLHNSAKTINLSGCYISSRDRQVKIRDLSLISMMDMLFNEVEIKINLLR